MTSEEKDIKIASLNKKLIDSDKVESELAKMVNNNHKQVVKFELENESLKEEIAFLKDECFRFIEWTRMQTTYYYNLDEGFWRFRVHNDKRLTTSEIFEIFKKEPKSQSK